MILKLKLYNKPFHWKKHQMFGQIYSSDGKRLNQDLNKNMSQELRTFKKEVNQLPKELKPRNINLQSEIKKDKEMGKFILKRKTFGFFDAVGDTATTTVKTAGNLVGKTVDTAVDTTKKVGGSAIEAAGGITKTAGKVAKPLLKTAGTVAGLAAGTMLGPFGLLAIPGAIVGNKLGGAAGDAVKGVGEAVQDLGNDIKH